MANVSVEGIQVEISKVSNKGTQAVTDLVTAMRQLRDVFKGNWYGNFPEKAKSVASGIDEINKAIGRLNTKKLKELAALAPKLKSIEKLSYNAARTQKKSNYSSNGAYGTDEWYQKNVVENNPNRPATGILKHSMTYDEYLQSDKYKSYVASLSQETKKATMNAAEFKAKLEQIKARDAQVAMTQKRVTEETRRSAINVRKMWDNFKKVFTTTRSTTKQTSKLFNAIKRIVMYRALRALLSAITNAIKEGITNLYQYSKIVNTEFADAMDSMKSSGTMLKNSFAAGISPALVSLIPLINKICEGFTAINNAVARLFARLRGDSTYTKAVYNAIEWQESTEATADAVEELKRQLLGIDELNVLNGNTSTSSGTGSSASTDYSEMFTEASVSEDRKNALETLLVYVELIKAKAKEIWETTKYWLTYCWTRIKEKATEIWGKIKEWFGNVKEKIVETFSNTWETVKEKAGNLFGNIKATYTLGVSVLKKVFNKEAWAAATTKVGDFFRNLYSSVQKNLWDDEGWLAANFKNGTIKKSVLTSLQKASDWIDDLWTVLNPANTEFGKNIKLGIKFVSDSVKNFFKKLFGDDAVEVAVDTTTAGVTATTNSGTSSASTTTYPWSKDANTSSGIYSGTYPTYTSKLLGAVQNTQIKWVNGTAEASSIKNVSKTTQDERFNALFYNKWLNKKLTHSEVLAAFKSGNISTSAYTYWYSQAQLAKGGVVAGPRRLGSYLVGESGAEAVVPLERNTEWIDKVSAKFVQSSGIDSTAPYVIMVDGSEWLKGVAKRNRENTLRTGKNILMSY